MTLGFSTKFPKGKRTLSERPTFFVEKVWKSLETKYDGENEVYSDWFGSNLVYDNYESFNQDIALGGYPKIHTIRKDSKNRWKAGNKIHPVINNRTPQRFQFAPTLYCVSIQDIEIRYDYPNNPEIPPYVFVDNELLDSKEIHELAINDGFNNTQEFFEWFDEDFEGKLIHWTDLKY